MADPRLPILPLPGTEIAVRASPRASRNAAGVKDGVIRVHVTAPPEDGRATAEVAFLLAKAIGVAETRLVLLRGAGARDKVFNLE